MMDKILNILLIIAIAYFVIALAGYKKSDGKGRNEAGRGFFTTSTESEKALKHPDRMTPEQRELADEWANGAKRLYVEQANALENRISERTAGGYVWGADSERRARASIEALGETIDRDDFLVVPRKFQEAAEAVRLFEAGCRWRSGLRHPSFPHISSSAQEGIWTADDGWIFPSPNESLEVARVCYSCHGRGVEIVKVNCDRCNGVGKIPAPLSGIIDFIDAAEKTIRAVDDIKHKRRTKTSSSSSKKEMVRCPGCNGNRKVEVSQPCSKCDGKGWRAS